MESNHHSLAPPRLHDRLLRVGKVPLAGNVERSISLLDVKLEGYVGKMGARAPESRVCVVPFRGSVGRDRRWVVGLIFPGHLTLLVMGQQAYACWAGGS